MVKGNNSYFLLKNCWEWSPVKMITIRSTDQFPSNSTSMFQCTSGRKHDWCISGQKVTPVDTTITAAVHEAVDCIPEWPTEAKQEGN
jgi:hypothetical protein